VTIAAVGDTSGYNLLRYGPDTQDPLEDVRDLLGQHDVFIFNYEGVILSETPPPGRCRRWPGQSSFYNPPWIADSLRPTQISIATLADNHILECGLEGIAETRRELSRRQILTVGAGETADEACRPVRLAVNGIRLAILADLAMHVDWFFAKSGRAGAASWDECRGERQVAELLALGDIVVVALHLHLGRGWTEHASPEHVALVRRILAGGADVVIAHGPHVPQGIVQDDGRLGLLSLGNFLFRPDYRMPEKAHRSIVARLVISPEAMAVALVPVKLDGSGRPRVPRSHEGTQILQEIATLSDALGSSVEVALTRATSPFSGDGKLDEAAGDLSVRAGGRARGAGSQLWQSHSL
jgi:hypothetical protein